MIFYCLFLCFLKFWDIFLRFCVFDFVFLWPFAFFLVAAFDDSTFVRDNYDDLDADTIERIVKIFGRINHIDEKEDQIRKNREAQAQAKH